MGLITERLALIIDGHSEGAVSAVRRLSLEEEAAAERAEILQAKLATLNTRIERSATGATATQRLQLSKLTNEYGQLTKGLANVSPFAQKAQTALSKVGLGGVASNATLGAIGKAAPGLLAGAAVFGGIAVIKSGIDGYVHLADAVRKVAQASGASAPDASRLVAITKALGINSDDAALGLFRLGKNIDLTPSKLTNFGVAIARTKAGNVDLIGTLDNVAAAYQRTDDPAKRAAIVYQAFGRAGATMLPILAANRAQLHGIAQEAQKQGLIFTSADLQRARDYQIATRELGDSFSALAINASKTLVPALTDAEHVLRDITSGPVAAGLKGIVKSIPGVGLIGDLSHLFGGGGKHKTSAYQQAQQQIQSEQDRAAQQALAQAAVGTLAGAFDTLAGPSNLADAKKNLGAARTSLEQAVASRNAAHRALTNTLAGTSTTSTSSAARIEATNQRVIAAEARLRAAQYVGGDARVATAKATLLSAQAELNRLRHAGTGKTNDLAGAEDRLRIAQQRVAAAQSKVKAAQHAVNVATGLSAADVLARQGAQLRSQTGLAGANVRLAASGLSTEVIGNLDKLEQQIPGTLAKVARTINAGMVSKLNNQQDALDAAQAEFGQAAANPELFKTAGQKAGQSFVSGFAGELTGALPVPYGARGTPKAAHGAPTSLTSTLYPGIQINVAKVETAAKTGTALAHDLAKQARKANLGVPANFQP